jgi:hypothetical protein
MELMDSKGATAGFSTSYLNTRRKFNNFESNGTKIRGRQPR